LAKQFSKGLIKAAIYYLVAVLVTWLTYKVWGHDYIHGPGLHHIVGFLALVGGVFWIVAGAAELFLNRQNKRNIGTLTVNVVVIASVVTYFMISFNEETGSSIQENKADMLTITVDSVTNSISAVDGLGDTVMHKVGDSTLVNKFK
jgi:hypothetical protein